MIHWLDFLLVLLVLPGFVFLGSSRLPACLRALGAQGALLGLLPLAGGVLSARVMLLSVIVISLKGFALPHFLGRAMQRADVRREVEPYIGFGLSVALGIAGLASSFWLASRLPLPPHVHSPLAVTVAFFNIFAGFLVLISRRKALTQVIGYLVLENGIYIFGAALALELPALVELGVLLDVFVAVFVMGIMIFHISRTFDHIDADRLSTLKE